MEENKGNYKIDAQGSLGLLALGDIGVQLWREAVKKEAELNKKNKKKDGKKTGK